MDTKPQFPKQVYAAWLAAGVGTVEQQARYRSALIWYGDQERGDLFTAPQPEPVAQPEVSVFPESIKIHSMVGLAAIKPGLAGAWRAWVLARAIDRPGKGEIVQSDLRAYLNHLGVSERLQRYWLAAATRRGLLSEKVYNRSGDRVYILASLGRGAAMVGAERTGRPSEVSALALVKSGWKAHLWAAYLVTLGGRPLSQKKKFEITGIEPRIQRLWQRPDRAGRALSYPIFRYSDCDIDPAKVEAMRELTGRHYVVTADGAIRQRLPDGRIVHPGVSRTLKRGRSRKAQKQLNDLSSCLGRGQAAIVRLFADVDSQVNRDDQAKRLLRQAWARDYDRRPEHVFIYPELRWRVTNYHAARVVPLLGSAL